MHAVECTITEILTHPTRLFVCLLRSPTGRMRKHARRQGVPEQSQELLSIFPWPLTRDEHTNPCGEREGRYFLSLSLISLGELSSSPTDHASRHGWLKSILSLSYACSRLSHTYIYTILCSSLFTCVRKISLILLSFTTILLSVPLHPETLIHTSTKTRESELDGDGERADSIALGSTKHCTVCWRRWKDERGRKGG